MSEPKFKPDSIVRAKRNISERRLFKQGRSITKGCYYKVTYHYHGPPSYGYNPPGAEIIENFILDVEGKQIKIPERFLKFFVQTELKELP